MIKLSLLRQDQFLSTNIKEVADAVQKDGICISTKLQTREKDGCFSDFIKQIFACIGIKFERTHTPHVAKKIQAFVQEKKSELFEGDERQQNITNLTIIFQQIFKTDGLSQKKTARNQKILNDCLRLLPQAAPTSRPQEPQDSEESQTTEDLESSSESDDSEDHLSSQDSEALDVFQGTQNDSHNLQERKQIAIAAALSEDEKIQADGNAYVFNGDEIRERCAHWGALLRAGEVGVVQILEDPNFVSTIRHFTAPIKHFFGDHFDEGTMARALGMINTFIDEKQEKADRETAEILRAQKLQQEKEAFAKKIEAESYSLNDAYDQTVKWENWIKSCASDRMIQSSLRIEPLIVRYLATVPFDETEKSKIALKNLLYLSIILNSEDLILTIMHKTALFSGRAQKFIFTNVLSAALNRDHVFFLRKLDEITGRNFLAKNIYNLWRSLFNVGSEKCIDYLLEKKLLSYQKEGKQSHVLELYVESDPDLTGFDGKNIAIAEKLKKGAFEVINVPFKVDDEEQTALTYAVQKGNFQLFADFLGYEGMDLMAHNQGQRALRLAIQERNVNIVEALLRSDSKEVLWEEAKNLIPGVIATDTIDIALDKFEQACRD
ncbi:putative uncharacterized protein [Parachlamydia acanthamoebae UV-7]|uniref:Uncharacterized protein n=2 Tax=Parachlamydia acanthamoebae TaxID=83552 RepID=F8KXL5_PARAV|nr:ankyrin repeat domain-containing protein [Parachlamydia acanthamoebae]KIA76962.1 hypothetical protein DB43_HC00270 [Parachlamydia acanthamoebae]CCB87366.1 putative uncharacterized protein [Parachlamydia acanthamoebae UV-7]